MRKSFLVSTVRISEDNARLVGSSSEQTNQYSATGGDLPAMRKLFTTEDTEGTDAKREFLIWDRTGYGFVSESTNSIFPLRSS